MINKEVWRERIRELLKEDSNQNSQEIIKKLEKEYSGGYRSEGINFPRAPSKVRDLNHFISDVINKFKEE